MKKMRKENRKKQISKKLRTDLENIKLSKKREGKKNMKEASKNRGNF